MKKATAKLSSNSEKPFNYLPFLPPIKGKVETVKILRQLVKSSVALAELKGIAKILPNTEILLNAVILKEARASSEIENVITTQDKLYQALSAKGFQVDSATKEVLRYREAMLHGFRFIQKKGFLSINAIVGAIWSQNRFDRVSAGSVPLRQTIILLAINSSFFKFR